MTHDDRTTYEVWAVGTVESPLTHLDDAPRQGDEGAPPAWIQLRPEFADAADGLTAGRRVVVVTWLDKARRDVLQISPRGDQARVPTGVFNTRSPHRPNPIGLHETEIVSVAGDRVQMRTLEAIDATPVIDIKPVLEPVAER